MLHVGGYAQDGVDGRRARRTGRGDPQTQWQRGGRAMSCCGRTVSAESTSEPSWPATTRLSAAGPRRSSFRGWLGWCRCTRAAPQCSQWPSWKRGCSTRRSSTSPRMAPRTGAAASWRPNWATSRFLPCSASGASTGCNRTAWSGTCPQRPELRDQGRLSRIAVVELNSNLGVYSVFVAGLGPDGALGRICAVGATPRIPPRLHPPAPVARFRARKCPPRAGRTSLPRVRSSSKSAHA